MDAAKSSYFPPHENTPSSTTAWSVDNATHDMDTAYHTQFSDWVRNPENIALMAHQLRRITADYDVALVAGGLRWITQGWPVEKTCVLLFSVLCYQSLCRQVPHVMC